ncbi:MAG: hypothetical protein HY320_10425 [Armatimonadetes bacterium]|nr:hypothetical protein [Armatimonadota bacterium]
MSRRTVLLVCISLVAVWGGSHLYAFCRDARQAHGRIVDSKFLRLEDRLGYHLYAPTWLPQGVALYSRGTIQGRFRILSCYVKPDITGGFILAQERRRPDREAYHQNLIRRTLEATTRVHGGVAYILDGEMGERRIAWATPDTWLFLSSADLPDHTLLSIANSVTDGAGPSGPLPSAGTVRESPPVPWQPVARG